MQPKSTPKSSTSGGQCDYQKLINGLRDASPAEKKLFDLPVDLVLSIADFLPKEDQACLALTCHGARDIFKERKLKLTKRETHRFLQVLQREHPTDIICQHRLQLVDRCHEPTADPGDRAAVKELRTAYNTRHIHPNRQPCKLTACVPIPSIWRPTFILTHEHIQRVMLRHRLGPDYGSSLDSLSHRSQLTKKETWAADYTCDTSLRFRIMDNKLYMHGKYVFKGKYLIRALTFTSHHFDICPHMYLDHDRGSYAGRQRVPVRLPGRKCRFLDFFCRCAVNGAFDPSWTTRRRSESDRQSYFTPPKSCRFCATDVAFSFDDVQELQTFEVDFWRCLGDGGLEDSDNFWLTGALSERNENGEGATAFRPIPRLMKAETFHRFSEADNPT
ncbi:hypothetical protein IWX90DRAFT_477797 [Phyllosticta citrichinensis]|uniref:F-box domain-containing protein n=1 Tax=Phyllosticta citrichinensis TaxID=1130410 RepID=A0ABR1XT94_9PEZI